VTPNALADRLRPHRLRPTLTQERQSVLAPRRRQTHPLDSLPQKVGRFGSNRREQSRPTHPDRPSPRKGRASWQSSEGAMAEVWKLRRQSVCASCPSPLLSDPATPFRSVVNRYVLCLDVTPQPFRRDPSTLQRRGDRRPPSRRAGRVSCSTPFPSCRDGSRKKFFRSWSRSLRNTAANQPALPEPRNGGYQHSRRIEIVSPAASWRVVSSAKPTKTRFPLIPTLFRRSRPHWIGG